MPKRETKEIIQSINDNKLSFIIVIISLVTAWIFNPVASDAAAASSIINIFNFIILVAILFKISQIVAILHRVTPMLVEHIRRVDSVEN